MQNSNSARLLTDSELAFLAAQIKRERQLEGYRRGGRFKASYRQKTVAKETIESTRPWEKATGAKTTQGKARVSQNSRYWMQLEFQAPSSDELDRACLPICEALDRFRAKMKRLSLGNVKVIVTSTIEGLAQCSAKSSISEARSALESGIVFIHKRSFKVRVSGAKLQDRGAIDALWFECQD